MSKRSREKHAKPEFLPNDGMGDNDGVCEECGFFPKQPNRDVCEDCAGVEREHEIS